MARIERVSHEADDTRILPKTREKSAPPMEGRHEKFQLGTNPMKMSAFEDSLVKLEVKQREDATRKYIHGIQGNDGGCFEHDQEKEESTLPLNTKPY